MAHGLLPFIPLLSISYGGRTMRFAAWPGSVHSHGEDYAPHPFMFVFDEWNQPTAWTRVEIHLDHPALMMTFPAPFSGASSLEATIQLVAERDPDRTLYRFDGVLLLDGDKIYFELRANPPRE
jgi:hypothetical protein